MNILLELPISYYGIAAFINFLTCVAIIALVVAQKRDSKLILLFFNFTGMIAIWSLCYSVWIFSSQREVAEFWLRTDMVLVSFLPPTFLHFVAELIKSRLRPWVHMVNYIVGGLIASIMYTDMFATSASAPHLVFPYWLKPGILFPVHLAYFFLSIGGGHLMMLRIMRSKTATIELKKQVFIVFWGTLIGFGSGIANYLSWYRLPAPPVTMPTVSFYVIALAYAVTKHQLMDIEVIIRRTAVFAGLFAFVYGTFTAVTIVGQEFFKGTLGWNPWLAAVPTVLIITFAMRPLETWLTNATEKFLFQKKYDYRELLKLFTTEILTVLQLDKLTQQTVLGLNNIIKLESAGMLLLDKDRKVYTLAASLGIKQKDVFLTADSTLVNYFKATSLPLLQDKNADKLEQSVLKDIFKQLNCKLCLPLEVHDELIGILCIGMKKSGEDYTQEDVDILSALARTLAIAISNARLFEELSRTQAEAAQREKMAVIGTLAAGINHEICNPLGIVRGQCEMFLLNLRDGLYKEKTSDDLLKLYCEIMTKVIRETDRATAITKRLSSFSKPIKMAELSDVPIEKQVDEVMELLGAEMRLSNIDVQKDFPTNFPHILADKKMIEEILFNIIRNAAQAIDTTVKRGRIVISGYQQRDEAIVRITDNGTGIPPEKLEQIFHPFYTTKAPGKGTGLGLFIVRQMVEKNKGGISVQSEFGVGTTLVLTFPTAAAAKLTHQAA